jgi:hypothetical protein
VLGLSALTLLLAVNLTFAATSRSVVSSERPPERATAHRRFQSHARDLTKLKVLIDQFRASTVALDCSTPEELKEYKYTGELSATKNEFSALSELAHRLRQELEESRSYAAKSRTADKLLLDEVLSDFQGWPRYLYGVLSGDKSLPNEADLASTRQLDDAKTANQFTLNRRRVFKGIDQIQSPSL